MVHGLNKAYERLVAVAVAALHEREPGRLWPLLGTALTDLCGGEAVVHKLDDWSENEGTVGVAPDAAATELGRLRDADLGLLRAGYPLADRVPLPGSSAPITGCLVYRSGTDFTDDHLTMAERAQPLLAGVERQRQLLEEWRRSPAPAGAPDERAADCALTPRETTVLLLLADALTADAIGRRLGISARTVHKHVENIYRKLGTRDRVGTVLRAQRLGLVPSPGAQEPCAGPP